MQGQKTLSLSYYAFIFTLLAQRLLLVYSVTRETAIFNALKAASSGIE